MFRRSVEKLLQRPQFQRNPLTMNTREVIGWWESRRIFFNLVVGCTGLVAVILMIGCGLIADATVGEAIGLPDGPLLGLFGIFFYAIFANILYTGGWICELLVRAATSAERSAAFGLKAFRIGVQFSVFVTLCPAAICWIAFAVALAKGQKHGPVGE